MRLKLTKQLRCDLEQVRCEALIPDHQHVTLDKGAVQRGARLAIDRLGEIEPDYLRAGVFRKRSEGESGHGRSLGTPWQTLSSGASRLKQNQR
jgi:hypothetical protein